MYGKKVFKMRQVNDVLEFEGANVDFVKNYFRLDDDLPEIISQISRDFLIERAVHAFLGLRIARQNPWECLISYICSTYKNIPAIKKMIFELAKRFGEETVFEDCVFYAFPTPEVLANASLDELERCKLGFRAKRVQETARIVNSKKIDFKALRRLDYEMAKDVLVQLPGVGNKAADCVLLFSMEKLEAFPLDVWMKRIVETHYADHFDETFIKKVSHRKSLSKKEYVEVSMFARNYFGKYAGYAQEYLFHFARTHKTHWHLSLKDDAYRTHLNL